MKAEYIDQHGRGGYGVCACAHGKQDHWRDENGISYCGPCPDWNDHDQHEYVSDEAEDDEA